MLIDATHQNCHNIPDITEKVAGYVTGTTDVQWTDADWQRFPHSGHVRIEQGFGAFDPIHCDVFDVEARAVTPAMAVQGVAARVHSGINWTDVYASDPDGSGFLAQVVNELHAAEAHYGHGWYYGHVGLWLADWDLSMTQAEALLGTERRGLTVDAVQWASPRSNPTTLVPGSSLTLAEAQVDLSVSLHGWHAAPTPAPPPMPPHLVSVTGTATYSDGSHKTFGF